MRVLSGIQPSGNLHIGNYFGMMKPALALQQEHQVYLFIANYHALTTVHNANIMRQGTLDVALDFWPAVWIHKKLCSIVRAMSQKLPN